MICMKAPRNEVLPPQVGVSIIFSTRVKVADIYILLTGWTEAFAHWTQAATSQFVEKLAAKARVSQHIPETHNSTSIR